jgi:hypothetical protein
MSHWRAPAQPAARTLRLAPSRLRHSGNSSTSSNGQELLLEKELISVFDVPRDRRHLPHSPERNRSRIHLYKSEASRPRVDTDLLIRRGPSRPLGA